MMGANYSEMFHVVNTLRCPAPRIWMTKQEFQYFFFTFVFLWKIYIGIYEKHKIEIGICNKKTNLACCTKKYNTKFVKCTFTPCTKF